MGLCKKAVRFLIGGWIWFVTAVIIGVAAKELDMGKDGIKSANVSGMFYPADARQLEKMVNAFIEQASVPDDIVPRKDDVLVAIVPHAGYVFSGPVAGYTYSLLSGGLNVDTVVLIGPTHYFPFYGAKLLDVDGYRVPNGVADVDKDAVDFLNEVSDIVEIDNVIFEREHCLEVQLPFLLNVMPDTKFVFMLVGQLDLKDIESVADVLAKLSEKKRILLIISTDMSHYHNLKDCIRIDWRTIDVVKKLDEKLLFSGLGSGECELCGGLPVAIGIAYAKKKADVEFRLLHYGTSADASGDTTRVVGYMAGVILKKSANKEESMFNKEQRKKLLSLARRSILHYLETGKRLDDLEVDDPALYRPYGAFVTLKKDGMLRGCIGHIIGDMPLCEVIAEMAIQAAVGDPRFPAVRKEEMNDIEIEISVLSPLKEVNSVNEIKVGKHGLLIRKGFNSGLLLPQVPIEYGWDKETFLKHLCQKAGLPQDAWKDPSAKIYSFTAEVFSEAEELSDKDGDKS